MKGLGNMIDLLGTEKAFLEPHIREGGTVVDFTLGNGHDTLWLSRKVGEHGKVYSFDIQEQAIESARSLLERENAPENYTLIRSSHHLVKDYVKEEICAGMFNLGYLPGGDKSITTMHETTLPAIEAAIDLLENGGGLLIAVYPGHPEGAVEGELIHEMLSRLDRKVICVSKLQIVNSPSSPFFFLVEKK